MDISKYNKLINLKKYYEAYEYLHEVIDDEEDDENIDSELLDLINDCRKKIAMFEYKNNNIFYSFVYFIKIEDCELTDKEKLARNESYYQTAIKYFNEKSITFAHLIFSQIKNYKDSETYINKIDSTYEDLLKQKDLFLLVKGLFYTEPLGSFHWRETISKTIQRYFKGKRKVLDKKDSYCFGFLDDRVDFHNKISMLAQYQEEKEQQAKEAVLNWFNTLKKEDINATLLSNINTLCKSRYCSSGYSIDYFYNGQKNYNYNWIGKVVYEQYKNLIKRAKELEREQEYVKIYEKDVQNLNFNFEMIGKAEEKPTYSNSTVDHINYYLKTYKDDALFYSIMEKNFEIQVEIIQNIINNNKQGHAKILIRSLLDFYEKDKNKTEILNQLLEKCRINLGIMPHWDEDKAVYLTKLADDLIDFPDLEKCELLQKELLLMKIAKKITSYGFSIKAGERFSQELKCFLTTKWNGHNTNCLCEMYNYQNLNTLGNTIMYKMASKYKKIIFFDTETTGLHPICDKMIEFAYVVYDGFSRNKMGIENRLVDSDDFLIKLPEERFLPRAVTELTNISDKDLQLKGISEAEAKEKIKNLIINNKDALFVAYNASFDLSFIFNLLKEDAYILYDINILDLYFAIKSCIKNHNEKNLTSYKLQDIIKEFNISGAINSHRAIDDAKALYYVLREFEEYGYGRDFVGFINHSFAPESPQYNLPQIIYHKYEN